MFRGEWQEDHAYGQGILTYSNNNVYEGQWQDDKVMHRVVTVWCTVIPPLPPHASPLACLLAQRHGFGMFFCAADGRRYEGEWLNGRRHGTGTLHFPNGDKFTAVWRDGELAGPVEYSFADDAPWANPDL